MLTNNSEAEGAGQFDPALPKQTISQGEAGMWDTRLPGGGLMPEMARSRQCCDPFCTLAPPAPLVCPQPLLGPENSSSSSVWPRPFPETAGVSFWEGTVCRVI